MLEVTMLDLTRSLTHVHPLDATALEVDLEVICELDDDAFVEAWFEQGDALADLEDPEPARGFGSTSR